MRSCANQGTPLCLFAALEVNFVPISLHPAIVDFGSLVLRRSGVGHLTDMSPRDDMKYALESLLSMAI